jgi:hypothetical protein
LDLISANFDRISDLKRLQTRAYCQGSYLGRWESRGASLYLILPYWRGSSSTSDAGPRLGGSGRRRWVVVLAAHPLNIGIGHAGIDRVSFVKLRSENDQSRPNLPIGFLALPSFSECGTCKSELDAAVLTIADVGDKCGRPRLYPKLCRKRAPAAHVCRARAGNGITARDQFAEHCRQCRAP